MAVSDQMLVDQCRTGDRDAFREIVERYQNLVCSVAYASTRNLSASEELAQEAFIAAWKSLKNLKDASKLKSWLCGIVRNLASNQRRRSTRDVLQSTADVENVEVSDSNALDPVDANIAQEEVDLVDSTLETLPDQYREPLVLYYREEQSIARVAEQLDLTTDTVKQRLSRGRNLLREEVTAIIERGLLRSAPGRAFTIAVISALPVMSSTAKAATLSVGAAKGLGAAKAMGAMQTGGLLGILGAIVGPLIGCLGGWFGYQMSLKSSRSPEETEYIKKSARYVMVLVLGFIIGLSVTVWMGTFLVQRNPLLYGLLIGGLTLGYTGALVALILWQNRKLTEIRKATGTEQISPEEAAAKLPAFMRNIQSWRCYKSKLKLLGLPLISIRMNGPIDANASWKETTALGWIAIGDRAYGVLYACGGIAVGGIACGGLSVGLISFGGCAIGGLAFGGGALGLIAIGGGAVGWSAFGGLALAIHAAQGGLAMAFNYAVGGLAYAKHVNDELAQAFFSNHLLLQYGEQLISPWVMLPLMLVGMSPIFLAMKLLPANQAAETRVE